MTQETVNNRQISDYRDENGRFTTGNPGGGRPKGSGLNLTNILKEELEKIPEGEKETYKVLFVKKLLQRAVIDGDMNALKLIINYCDGLPKQTFSGDVGLPIPILQISKEIADKNNLNV
jgi:hypothetical protein